MNILFLSIGDIPSIKHREIYPDLLREFVKNGHKVFAVCSRERRKNVPTEIIEEDGAVLLKVKIGNITKTNLIEKGISTITVNREYKAAIKKYFGDVQFDLLLYSTPPITLVDCIEYIKKRDHAKTYLLLKDIFPQNAVDLGMFSKTGVKGCLYKYFRRKEKKLYAISDRIGCMSQANVDYVISNNPEISPKSVEVCPNSIEFFDMSVDDNTRNEIRKKYSIPLDKKVFVYGGNLGKPQGIDFMIKCLDSQKNNKEAFFLIVGDGTEFEKINNYINTNQSKNMALLKRLPKDDYDKMVSSCDVGLVFLDYRFSIPNFPSRVLGYMQAGIPVIACTDKNTDFGTTIVEGEFGWWGQSDVVDNFAQCISDALRADLHTKGLNGKNYLMEHYLVEHTYRIIENSIMK